MEDFDHLYGNVMDLTVDDQTLDLTCLDAVIPAEANDQANGREAAVEQAPPQEEEHLTSAKEAGQTRAKTSADGRTPPRSGVRHAAARVPSRCNFVNFLLGFSGAASGKILPSARRTGDPRQYSTFGFPHADASGH